MQKAQENNNRMEAQSYHLKRNWIWYIIAVSCDHGYEFLSHYLDHESHHSGHKVITLTFEIINITLKKT